MYEGINLECHNVNYFQYWLTWLFILFHMYSQIHLPIFFSSHSFCFNSFFFFFLVLMICFSLLPSLLQLPSFTCFACPYSQNAFASCFSIFPPLLLFCAPRPSIHPAIATTRRFVKSKKAASHLLAVCLLISFIPSRSIPERWSSCRS